MNWRFPSLHGGSTEITVIVPLKGKFKFAFFSIEEALSIIRFNNCKCKIVSGILDINKESVKTTINSLFLVNTVFVQVNPLL